MYACCQPDGVGCRGIARQTLMTGVPNGLQHLQLTGWSEESLRCGHA